VTSPLDRRPIIIALAGPNGAGKSTFYEAFLQPAGLRFLNADDIARTVGVEAYDAASVTNALRVELTTRRESFVFETVFSDPVGDKVQFLAVAAKSGYTVALLFIGLDSAATSNARVALRVLQGGHDVPPDKIRARYERTLANLARAIRELPYVYVYDNSDLARPFRQIAEFAGGQAVFVAQPLPKWFARFAI
jgi:predicted ABC-type ATPase